MIGYEWGSPERLTPGIWTAGAEKPRTVLQGLHLSDGQCFSISPDGKWLAVPEDEGGRTVKVCDTMTSKVVHTIRCQSGPPTWCTWSPDGSMLAVAEHAANNAVRLWDPQTEKVLRSLEGPDGWAENLSWSPDGKTVISADKKGTIRHWDHATSTELRTAQGPPSVHVFDLDSAAYSADLKLMAAHGIAGACVLWDVAENRELGVLAARPREQSIAISPEGHWCGTPRADQFIVYVVRTAKGQEVLTPKQFEDKYDWKNDPDKVRLTDR